MATDHLMQMLNVSFKFSLAERMQQFEPCTGYVTISGQLRKAATAAWIQLSGTPAYRSVQMNSQRYCSTMIVINGELVKPVG